MRNVNLQMVRDLKRKALEVLQIDNALFDTVRLREEHRTNGLQPPCRFHLVLYSCLVVIFFYEIVN